MEAPEFLIPIVDFAPCPILLAKIRLWIWQNDYDIGVETFSRNTRKNAIK
jgi:hypothetical protein